MIADLLERLWMSCFQTYRHMVLLMYTSNPVLALKAEEAPFFWGLNELYLPSSTQFSKWKTAAIELFSAVKFSVIVSGDICGKTKEQSVSQRSLQKNHLSLKVQWKIRDCFLQEAQNPSRLCSPCWLLVSTTFQDSPCIPASFVILWHSVQVMVSPVAFKTITLRGEWGTQSFT